AGARARRRLGRGALEGRPQRPGRRGGGRGGRRRSGRR
ncbi:MAG: 30S ribosomal protein S3, partial [Deltaproteobacteria bacterium]|nr:30S ribosomal protein S3 [Deltaproteobacteria bacterium]